jgi:hypothetical protein
MAPNYEQRQSVEALALIFGGGVLLFEKMRQDDRSVIMEDVGIKRGLSYEWNIM